MVILARSITGMARQFTLRGIVFDMDGTLTVPCIDFAEMRRRVGITSPDILHEISSWSDERQRKAYEIIAEIEKEAKENMKVMPGALELCNFLDSKKIRRGLITRNVKDSVDYFHSRAELGKFSPALSREFTPYKPDPAPLLHICKAWRVHPSEVMMVGDSAKDDIVCGNRAGAFTCLLDESNAHEMDALAEEQRPSFKISSLAQMQEILTTNFLLLPVGETLSEAKL